MSGSSSDHDDEEEDDTNDNDGCWDAHDQQESSCDVEVFGFAPYEDDEEWYCDDWDTYDEYAPSVLAPLLLRRTLRFVRPPAPGHRLRFSREKGFQRVLVSANDRTICLSENGERSAWYGTESVESVGFVSLEDGCLCSVPGFPFMQALMDNSVCLWNKSGSALLMSAGGELLNAVDGLGQLGDPLEANEAFLLTTQAVLAWPSLRVVHRYENGRNERERRLLYCSLAPGSLLYEYDSRKGRLRCIDLRRGVQLSECQVVPPLDEDEWVSSFSVSPHGKFALFFPCIFHGLEAKFQPVVYPLTELAGAIRPCFSRQFVDSTGSFCSFLGPNDDMLVVASYTLLQGSTSNLYDLHSGKRVVRKRRRHVLPNLKLGDPESSHPALNMWQADGSILMHPVHNEPRSPPSRKDLFNMRFMRQQPSKSVNGYRIFDSERHTVRVTSWFTTWDSDPILAAKVGARGQSLSVLTGSHVFIFEENSLMYERVTTFVLCARQLHLFPNEILMRIVKFMYKRSKQIIPERILERSTLSVSRLQAASKEAFEGEPSAVCRTCKESLNKSRYSKTQWKKKANARTCLKCSIEIWSM